MPKEIAKQQKQIYYKCTHCGDEIFCNAHKKLIRCKCGKIYIDSCEDYVRIGGNKSDYKIIRK